MSLPRYLSLVSFQFEDIPVGVHGQYPFVKDRPYIFLGEIPNMPGHCVVVDYITGQIYSGYHSENFGEIPDEED